jgi:hypothetical protein
MMVIETNRKSVDSSINNLTADENIESQRRKGHLSEKESRSENLLSSGNRSERNQSTFQKNAPL